MVSIKKTKKSIKRIGRNKVGFHIDKRIWLVIVMAAVLIVASVCAGLLAHDFTKDKEDSSLPGDEIPRASAADLEVLAECGHTGLFVEDGKNEPIENVAALLIRNNSSEFLDRATVVYDISGKEATFIVTGLPPGKSAWVQEQSKLILGAAEVFELRRDATKVAFTNTALLDTDDLEVMADGNSLTVKNVSNKDLANVALYYKNMSSDGSYLGGITYMLAFDSIAAGDSVTRQASHFSDTSEIVRYSYQDT